MKNVPNVYTQHQPYIVNILANLFQGKLKETEFKTTSLHSFYEKYILIFPRTFQNIYIIIDPKRLSSLLLEAPLMKKLGLSIR